MSAKENLFIGATVICLLVGAERMLAPKSVDDLNRQVQEQRLDDLADAQENQSDRRRDELRESIDNENREKVRPVEKRPPELPRIRMRLP